MFSCSYPNSRDNSKWRAASPARPSPGRDTAKLRDNDPAAPTSSEAITQLRNTTDLRMAKIIGNSRHNMPSM